MNKNNLFFPSEKFLSKNLTMGFTMSELGDVRNESALQSLAQSLSVSIKDFIIMSQVHGDHIEWVSHKNADNILSETDAILTNEAKLFLVVRTADCIPLMLADLKQRVIGVVHAGWRGLYARIIQKTIDECIQKGSDPSNIIVFIGPCIHSCCYNITKERSDKFITQFQGEYETIKYIVQKDAKIYLDMPALARLQLEKAGIPPVNISDSGICTMEHNQFYSFRRQKDESGRFAGFIAMK